MNDGITIGMDLGDKTHIAVVLDADGNELDVSTVINTKAGINKYSIQSAYSHISKS